VAQICRRLGTCTWERSRSDLRRNAPRLVTNGTEVTRPIMAGSQRTPLTPLQVGAIKEMVTNKKVNGDVRVGGALYRPTVSAVRRARGRAGGRARGRG